MPDFHEGMPCAWNGLSFKLIESGALRRLNGMTEQH